MVAFRYLPYAIATGNTFILKPSERVPLTMRYVYELLEKTGLPKGVVNLVNGGKAAVDALIDHPKVERSACRIDAGSALYLVALPSRAARGTRAEPRIRRVLPGADMPMATQIISDSAFGCASLALLAVPVAVTVGEAQRRSATRSPTLLPN